MCDIVRGKKRKRNNWLQRHARDPYVRRAKAQGYRTRATFKIMELDRSDRLFRPGLVVVELGSAPGGWSQYVYSKISPGGTLVAVDLKEMPPIPGVTFVCGDMSRFDIKRKIIDCLPEGSADLVISDAAPNITGIGAVDQSKTLALLEDSLDLACTVLKPGGRFLVKLREGGDMQGFRRRCALYFKQCAARKPGASRARSPEVYLLGTGFLSGKRSL